MDRSFRSLCGDHLEEKLKEITGASYCVTLSFGTAALHLALKALDMSKPAILYFAQALLLSLWFAL
ncbi:DegT/DnrJ/EryC1/StrS family aminotransferase [Bacteroidetes bacterium endosymbiont of Geopemphigus sp.]|uniref:DegT/DnrJ/EryC1/StrS family aminotransferase n=1 Tax=Bacteroidetes bacterium endosymbiont of Geopemphigus sp. TaxID=2047937 RepID=UPI000CD1751B|nr:DegT/DnrJ/EryC1/StrS family aminotransferase [Bacteroidetes bacterium endosymbiont of Geopemphigus sp.]